METNEMSAPDFSADIFNVSQEFEDLQITIDEAGTVALSVNARRC